MVSPLQQSFPYYNDFDPNKKFHGVLFKPGFPVQARELTHIQSYLQNQISRFGDNIFKQGTVISGCAESHNFEHPYVKVLDSDFDLADYEGEVVIGQITGVRAIIKKTQTGSEADSPNLNTLFIQYISGGTDAATFQFDNDEPLVLESDEDVTFTIADVTETAVGKGSLISVDDGIVYANGYFVLHSSQTVVVEAYSTSPSKKVGFVVTEEIIDSDDDSSLLDPARGSQNETAPGADRFKLTTELVVLDIDDVKPDGFYLLFEIEEGVVKRRYDKTQYAELGKELARRTYDESGDYTVRAFPLIVREHLNTGSNNGRYTEDEGGDASKLVIGVESGKAYVRGFEQELLSTESLSVDKAIDTIESENQPVSTAYGNYFIVTALAPLFTTAININDGSLVQLTDGADVIGTARVRSLAHAGGAVGAGGTYNFYVSDIILTDGSIDDVTEIWDMDDAVAAVVSSGPLSTKFNTLVFPTPDKNLKEIADSSFVYQKQFSTVAVSTGGAFSISLGAGETWAFSSTPDATVDNEIIVISETAFAGGTLGTVAAGVVFDFANGTRTVTYTSSTVLNFAFNQTTTGTPKVTVLVNVRKTSAAPNTKTVRDNRCVKINTQTHPNTNTGVYTLGFTDIIEVKNIWIADNTETYPNIDLATTAPSAPWIDVTDQFDVDNGQRDGAYELGFITKKASSSLDLGNQKIIIRVKYFEHGGSSGYYAINSYPLPVENESPDATEIEWHELPNYTSTTGEVFVLRDAIDFRITADRVSKDKTLVNSGTPTNDGTENPANYTTLNKTFANVAVLTPVATEELITDLTQFIGRIDRVVLDIEGTFSATRGVPNLNPVRPREPDNSLTLGFVMIPPYPSLSPFMAKLVGRPEFATKIVLSDNRRFTMRDIGEISKRIDRLEYYTSLSLLEQATENLMIVGGSGENRFKNGILVDGFDGHNIGEVTDPTYRCSIANGELRPYFNLENIDLQISVDSTNVVRKAADTIVVVRQIITDQAFAEGDIVSVVTSGAFGTIEKVVILGTNTTYRWVRIYLTNVSGTFAENNIVESSASGIISYTGITTDAIPTDLRPNLVVVPLNGNLITLPYEHTIFSLSPYASKTRNCVSALLFTYDGTITLDPPVDVWTDVNVTPEVQNNENGTLDNWVYIDRFSGWGTQWGSWQNIWQYSGWGFGGSWGVGSGWGNGGYNASITADMIDWEAGGVGGYGWGQYKLKASTTTQRRREEVSPKAPSISGVSLVPYMRSIVMTFTASRMKPNTKVYAFFDGINVSDHCKMSSDGTYGSTLTTDTDGALVGQFRVPAGQFTVGTKKFILADNPTDFESSDTSTIGSASFTASGMTVVESGTVQSTQTPDCTTRRSISGMHPVIGRQVGLFSLSPFGVFGAFQTFDPIAQTFFVGSVPNGLLLTKADIYFRSRSSTSPITLEIREVVNGYPSETIVPYSQVTLSPKDVNVSEDATAATEFKFSAPVYLKNDTEYCFVLLPAGNDENYNVWVAELGENHIGTTERIDKQPNSGVLFVSANNRTWTAFQNEDMKFTLWAAAFETGVSGNLLLRNAPTDYLTVDTVLNPGDRITSDDGEGIVRYFDSIRNISHVTVTDGFFVVGAATRLNDQGSELGDIEITSVEEVLVNAISPTISSLNFNNTGLRWEYKLYSSTEAPMASYESLNPQGTTLLPVERAVFSHSVEQEDIGIDADLGSFVVRGVLTTSVATLSPVVDLSKVAAVVISNDVNNDSDDEDTNAGDARSRYITRRVALDDGQEAEDLRVYLTTELVPGTDIKVYAKLLSDVDDTSFTERPWLEMDVEAPINIVGPAEYLFTLPIGGTDTVEGGRDSGTGVYEYSDAGVYTGFKTFAVKIVLLSSTTARVPIVRDLRAIALQV